MTRDARAPNPNNQAENLLQLETRMRQVMAVLRDATARFKNSADFTNYVTKTYGFWSQVTGATPGSGQGNPLERKVLLTLWDLVAAQMNWGQIRVYIAALADSLAQDAGLEEAQRDHMTRDQKVLHRFVINLQNCVRDEELWQQQQTYESSRLTSEKKPRKRTKR